MRPERPPTMLGVALLFMGVAPLHAQTSTLAAEHARAVQPFMEQYCFKCHNEKKKMSGLRLDDLSAEISGRTGNANLWQEVMDKINLGEMPPEDARQPSPQTAAATTTWIGDALREYGRAAHATGGRGVMRRLNRDEFGNTVADLLSLDRATVRTIVADLPGEGLVDGFNNIASGLMVDPSLMAEYLVIARKVADLAIVAGEPPVPTQKQRILFKDDPQPAMEEKIWKQPRMVITEAFIAQRMKANNSASFDRGGEAPVTLPGPSGTVVAYSGINRFGGELTLRVPTTAVVVEGDYLIRLRAGAFPGTGALQRPIKVSLKQGRNNLYQVDAGVFITAPENAPEIYELRVHLKPPPKEAGQKGPGGDQLGFTWNGERTIIGNPDRMKPEVNFKQPGISNEEKVKRHAALMRLDTVERMYDPKIDMKQAPRLVVDWAEVEGPLYGEWPPKSYTTVFFEGEKARKDEAYLRRIITRLASRAYRRPADAGDVEPPLKLATTVLAKGASFEDAVKRGLESVLCSPNFIFLREPSVDTTGKRALSDYELACRLSFFLWSTMPDNELFSLATQGKLKQPAVLQAQVLRMLKDAKSAEFVENFAGQWLALRSVGSIKPDARLYAAYHKEGIEKWSIRETYAFFDHILRNDLSVLNFINSDFAMLNEPMAKFYGIAGVSGENFRPVKLPAGSQRGGVVSQASILSLGADGIRTKPVTRAKWVMSTLFNDPPNPPPANAGEVEPNSAGENLTVRQRLDKHRSVATCASCHTRLDPFGLGLENYNAVGAWRDQQDGENFRAANAPRIDASGSFTTKATFTDSATYRAALMQMKDKFAKGLTEKLLTYALGRSLEHTDRATVTQLTTDLARNDYRMVHLIQSIVSSAAFQTK